MNPLTEYSKNGQTFSIYCRAGDLAIFHGRKVAGKSETWEVIHIQSHDGREIAGKHYEPAEYPPSNEQWDAKGWTFVNPESARISFELEINKSLNNN